MDNTILTFLDDPVPQVGEFLPNFDFFDSLHARFMQIWRVFPPYTMYELTGENQKSKFASAKDMLSFPPIGVLYLIE